MLSSELAINLIETAKRAYALMNRRIYRIHMPEDQLKAIQKDYDLYVFTSEGVSDDNRICGIKVLTHSCPFQLGIHFDVYE